MPKVLMNIIFEYCYEFNSEIIKNIKVSFKYIEYLDQLPNGKIICGGSNNTNDHLIDIFDPITYDKLLSFSITNFSQILMLKNNNILVACYEMLSYYDTDTGKIFKIIHINNVKPICILSDESIILSNSYWDKISQLFSVRFDNNTISSIYNNKNFNIDSSLLLPENKFVGVTVNDFRLYIYLFDFNITYDEPMIILKWDHIKIISPEYISKTYFIDDDIVLISYIDIILIINFKQKNINTIKYPKSGYNIKYTKIENDKILLITLTNIIILDIINFTCKEYNLPIDDGLILYSGYLPDDRLLLVINNKLFILEIKNSNIIYEEYPNIFLPNSIPRNIRLLTKNGDFIVSNYRELLVFQ